MTNAYNTIGHVCRLTGRVAVSIENAHALMAAGDPRSVWDYNPVDAEFGRDPWKPVALAVWLQTKGLWIIYFKNGGTLRGMRSSYTLYMDAP